MRSPTRSNSTPSASTTAPPRPWRAWRSCALLATVAAVLIVGSDRLLDLFPVRVRVTGSGTTAAMSLGGVTRDVALARPIRAVRFVPGEPHRREYQIDGSDTTNNATFDPAYFAAFSSSPYYRFQAWLRDEASYSTWQDLAVRDAEGRLVARQAQPRPGETLRLPPAFDLSVHLRRMEAPRAIELVDDTGVAARIDINRNDKYVRVAQPVPDGPPLELARWYLPLDWLPALASVLHLLLRSCAVALLLVVLVVPLAALLPAAPGRVAATVVPALAVVVVLAASLYTSVGLFDRSPHIRDAISYYFQGKTFADGLLAAPAPPVAEAFPLQFMVIHDGKWFSMYTPGTALLLAVGFAAGVPWLVGPLLAAAGTLLTYGVARPHYGRRTALVAVVRMASSPFLHLQAGSFMSHVPGMFWAASLLYAATRYVERPAAGWAVAAAAALGFLFLTREMSALLYVLTVGCYTGWRGVRGDRRRALRDAPIALACLALFFGAYLLYNRALTGSPALLPRRLFSATENSYGFGEGVGFYGRHTLGGGLVNADEALTSLTIYLFGWPFYLSLALIALPFLLRRARARDLLHGAIVGAFVLAYIGLYYHGIALGPRYYFDALPSLVLLTARGFVALAGATAALCRAGGRRDTRPRARAAALVLCAALLACNALYFWPQQTRLYRPLAGRPGTGRLVLGDFIRRERAGRVGAVPHAVVIMREPGLADIFGPLNCPRLDCETIFAYLPVGASDAPLRAAFPGRRWYSVVNRDGVLTLQPEE
jgi:4-amino-4-deoxy-L-arabinose transferase-like glycosyltransferase